MLVSVMLMDGARNKLLSTKVEKSVTTERAKQKYAEQCKSLDVRVCDNAFYIDFPRVP